MVELSTWDRDHMAHKAQDDITIWPSTEKVCQPPSQREKNGHTDKDYSCLEMAIPYFFW